MGKNSSSVLNVLSTVSSLDQSVTKTVIQNFHEVNMNGLNLTEYTLV